MQLQIGAGLAAFLARFSDLVDVDLALPERVLQPDSIAVCSTAVGLNAVCPGKGGRTEKATPEPRALLIRPIHQPNGNGGPAVEVLCEAAQHLETGENSERAVEPAAVGDGVEMTAEN